MRNSLQSIFDEFYSCDESRKYIAKHIIIYFKAAAKGIFGEVSNYPSEERHRLLFKIQEDGFFSLAPVNQTPEKIEEFKQYDNNGRTITKFLNKLKSGKKDPELWEFLFILLSWLQGRADDQVYANEVREKLLKKFPNKAIELYEAVCEICDDNNKPRPSIDTFKKWMGKSETAEQDNNDNAENNTKEYSKESLGTKKENNSLSNDQIQKMALKLQSLGKDVLLSVEIKVPTFSNDLDTEAIEGNIYCRYERVNFEAEGLLYSYNLSLNRVRLSFQTNGVSFQEAYLASNINPIIDYWRSEEPPYKWEIKIEDRIKGKPLYGNLLRSSNGILFYAKIEDNEKFSKVISQKIVEDQDLMIEPVSKRNSTAQCDLSKQRIILELIEREMLQLLNEENEYRCNFEENDDK